jgi:class 3 adenylate cyclase/ABC-type molybdenum transport system ATPase subunit/photorepair protein PhrA
LAATTEHVTVLITDLVGSTELSTGLPPKEADQLRRNHFSLLRRAIDSNGGTEVKNLGDGLFVVFPVASSAISCAVAMQQAVEEDNRRSSKSLGLRVGVSVGEATREGDDYFGDPVVEAARLCASCEGGQILASDLVRAMAGRRSNHHFRSFGNLSLKGFQDPIETFEILWEPLEQSEQEKQTPLPSRLLTASAGVVGRHAESAALLQALHRATEGGGIETVLISGEPGLGKTTLAARLARDAHANGAVVLLGRCHEDLGTPYGPIKEAIRHCVTYMSDEDIRGHVDEYGAELALLAPILSTRIGNLPTPQSSDPDAERYLLFAAVAGLLRQVAIEQSVVLIFDDIQWADKPSLLLLRSLVANGELGQLMIIGTYRSAELSDQHPLTETLVALRREQRVTEINLTGLSGEDVVALVERAAGHALEEPGILLAQALYRETDGNPFFVEEVLRHLIETGDIFAADERWTTNVDLARLKLPDSIRQVVGSRVGRLGDGALYVLPVASVIGREFDLELLAAVTNRREDELIDILDGAAAAALIVEDVDVPERYSFSHALIQHTLYQGLGPSRQARTHRSVAEALEGFEDDRSNVHISELAYHWSRATRPVDEMKAVGYAQRCAEMALDALAPDEAIRYYTQAISLLGDSELNDHGVLGIDLLIGLGTAQRQAGLPEYRISLLQAAYSAEAKGAADQLIAAALSNSRGWFSSVGKVDFERVAVLQAALSALPEVDSSERALVLAALCSELSFDNRVAWRNDLGLEALRIARRLPDPSTLLDVLLKLNIPRQVPEDLGNRLDSTREAIELAKAKGDLSQQFLAGAFGEIDAVQAGDFELAEQCMMTMREIGNRLRQPIFLWNFRFREAGEALLAGDQIQAEAIAADACQIGEASGQPDTLTTFGGQIIVVNHQRGTLKDLIPMIELAEAENPGIPLLSVLLGLAHLESGAHDAGKQVLESFVSDVDVSLPQDLFWMVGMASLAELAIGLGSEAQAAVILKLILPYADQIPYAGAFPLDPVSYYIAGLFSVLGRIEEALRYSESAAKLADAGGMKFSSARVALQRGRILAVNNELDAGVRSIQFALEVALANGYSAVAAKANLELEGMA